jgi:glycerol-3-phosphate acyltransferase PlsY
MQNALILLSAYLLGSLPFSYWVVKWVTGEDIRQHFSKNAGATNAGRVLEYFAKSKVQKKRSRILKKGIFLLDVLKGVAAVCLTRHFQVSSPEILLAGIFAVTGHIFSPFLAFKGGKGVATSFGVLLALVPDVAGCTFLLWFFVYFFSGYVSLGSVIGSLGLPVFFYVLHPEQFKNNWPLTSTLIFLSIFVTLKHSSNLKNLLEGTESKERGAKK